MSNARYIEFDSTYRNRNQWPLPGQFEILISQTGRKGGVDAVDPYSESAAKVKWIGNNFEADALGTASNTVLVDLTAGVGTSADNTTFVVDDVAGELQSINGYYHNATITDAAGDRRSIISYTYLGNDRAEITIESAFPTTLVDNAPLIIDDPTDLSSTTNPLFFVPDGRSGVNAYAGCVLYNETRDEYRTITNYDFITHLLTVNTSQSNVSVIGGGPITTWAATDTYSIRRAAPSACVTLNGTTVSGSSFSVPSANTFSTLEGSFLEKTNILTAAQRAGALIAGGTTTVQLAATAVAIDDFYNGCTLRMTSGAAIGQITTIVDYVGATQIATLSPGFTVATAGGDSYLIQCPIETSRIVKYVDFRANAVAGTLTTIQFPTIASSLDGFYNGLYVDAGVSGIRLITNYDGATRTATVSVAFGFAPVAGQAFTITSGVVSPPFDSGLSTDDVCILPFTADNMNPFVYTGSQVSQQEMVCYEIELLNLVLPNKTLATGFGSRIAFYPYVYVEISNVSGASAGMKNTIYSNNPNAARMVFRVAIDDVPNPIISSFVKVDGDGMVQTLKFKPNDNLRFSVRLPNGEVYQTLDPEDFSPNSPNPDIQISALFSIKRL